MPAVEEPALAGLDPFDLMETEAARIERFYRRLRPAEWHAPTRCAGWDRRALLAHLAAVEDFTRAVLDGTVHVLHEKARNRDFNEWGIAQRATRTPEQVLTDWCELFTDNLARLRERGYDGTLDTRWGAYPAGRQAFYLASEYAIHADDAGVPVDPAGAEARCHWRLRFARSALAEADRGLTVVADRGSHTVRLGDLEARLTDEEFVEAASGRLDPDVDVPPRLRAALVVLA